MFSIFLFIGLLASIMSAIFLHSKSGEEYAKYTKFVNISAITLSLLFVANLFIIKIPAGEVGILITPTGVSQNTLYTGWHLVAPWNSVEEMDKTVQVYSFTNTKNEGAKQTNDAIWVPTIDGIKMGFDVSIRWRIDPKFAWWIYDNVEDKESEPLSWVEENIIRAVSKSVIGLTVSKYTPIEVYSDKRIHIQNNITKELASLIKKSHIIIEAVDIREVYYNKAYENTLNEKKNAEQKVFILEQVTRQKEEERKQALIDKDIKITQAEAESKSLQIKGQSISNNPKIIELEWINAWKAGGSQVPQVISGSNGSSFLLNMDLRK